jgi:FkbM family methyltransferase
LLFGLVFGARPTNRIAFSPPHEVNDGLASVKSHKTSYPPVLRPNNAEMNLGHFVMNIRFLLRRIKIFILNPIRIRLFPPRSLNSYIYDKIKRGHLPHPDIETHACEHYSQCGEDIIVLGVLRAFALKNNIDPAKYFFCEIGANHPIAMSSTYLLAKELKMKGLLVEANPQLIADLVRARPESKVVNMAVSDQNLDQVTFYLSHHSEISSLSQTHVQDWREGVVGEKKAIHCPAIRYDDLIERYLEGSRPLFVSIDIEGYDFKVLVDMNLEKYGPLLLQLEASDDFDQEITGDMIKHLETNGYSVLAKTRFNLIAQRKDTSFWTRNALPGL